MNPVAHVHALALLKEINKQYCPICAPIDTRYVSALTMALVSLSGITTEHVGTDGLSNARYIWYDFPAS